MADGGATIEVVAALIYRESRLLVCQRNEEANHPLKWEFPGGKLEGGEGCLAGLRRELKEELGIEVQSAKEIFRHSHIYPDKTEVNLTFFKVNDYQREVINLAFRQILWVEVQELGNFEFLEGDLPLIDKVVRKEL